MSLARVWFLEQCPRDLVKLWDIAGPTPNESTKNPTISVCNFYSWMYNPSFGLWSNPWEKKRDPDQRFRTTEYWRPTPKESTKKTNSFRFATCNSWMWNPSFGLWSNPWEKKKRSGSTFQNDQILLGPLPTSQQKTQQFLVCNFYSWMYNPSFGLGSDPW